VRNAARVARTFRMDPLTVLAGASSRADRLPFRMAWPIRVACHNVVMADESPSDDITGVEIA
jgi:hypothetical protein